MSAPSDDVIPLSRWRAALARARKTRRADAILAEPDAERLIPRLPVQELYYAIKEVGLADAQELVAMASPEQVRGFLDLDVWQRDRLDETRMREWMDALVEAGPVAVKNAIEALDPEVVALYIQRHARVYDLTLEDEAIPEQPEGHFFPTPDRFFILDILAEGEAGKSLERMIDWLYRADLEIARRVVMSARWELGSDLEEYSYRWRTGRMADLGYAEFYEALSIYRYVDPASVKIDEGTAPASAVSSGELPVQLAAALDDRGPFARALGTVENPMEIETLQSLLMLLVNKAMAADLVEPADVDRAKATLERTVSYLDIGLEYLSRGDTARAGQALRTIALERVFRVGVSLTLHLKRLADALGKTGVGAALLDPSEAAAVASLRAVRPWFPKELDNPPGTGARPFRSLEDIRRAAAALEEAAQRGPFVLGAFSSGPEALAEAVQGSITPPSQVRFGTLVRTAAAQVLLGRPPDLSPLHPRELRQVGARLAEPGAGDVVEAAFRQRIRERGLATPPALDRWLTVWLGELGATLERADGVLVRYSWLK